MNWADSHVVFVAPAYLTTGAVFAGLAARAIWRLWRAKHPPP